MSDGPQYRTGTTSVTLSAALTQDQLRDGIRDALLAVLEDSGEHLAQFDFGPPRRAAEPGLRSFDVMYRTGPPASTTTGPQVMEEPPQMGV